MNVLLTLVLQAKALISAKCEKVEQNKAMCFTLERLYLIDVHG